MHVSRKTVMESSKRLYISSSHLIAVYNETKEKVEQKKR
jgi:hypothetical protein